MYSAILAFVGDRRGGGGKVLMTYAFLSAARYRALPTGSPASSSVSKGMGLRIQSIAPVRGLRFQTHSSAIGGISPLKRAASIGLRRKRTYVETLPNIECRI